MNLNCTIYKTLELMGKKWTLLIVLELYRGKNKKKRYSQIKKMIPEITPKILSQRLKELEENKMLIKTIDTSKFPIKTEYVLTKSGREIILIIKSIKSWGLKYNVRNKYCVKTDCEHCEF